MSFSEFLNSRRDDAKALIRELKKNFSYASILGADIKTKSIHVDRNTSNIGTGRDTECGFVIKLCDSQMIYEYSLDDIHGDIPALAATITEAFRLNSKLRQSAVGGLNLTDEPLVRSFCRPSDLQDFSDDQILEHCKKNRDALLSASEYFLNAFAVVSSYEVSKLFISEHRELDQHFVWINGNMMGIYKETEKLVQVYEGVYGDQMCDVLEKMPTLIDKLLKKARIITQAKPIDPGVYDVITDPSITGLIAHEAFGHGVEMDQFVKDRALAKKYVGKYVASPICNMRDGAASTLSAGSYFFDDDGVLAGNTQIIRDGILVTGISDLASAAQ